MTRAATPSPRRRAGLLLGTVALSTAVMSGPAALAAETSPSPSGDHARVTVVQDDFGAELSDPVVAAIERAATEISAPGLVVAIETPAGRWIGTLGTKDWGSNGRDGTVPMTADIHQRIGSVTKTFTVTALLQLASQGLLSLDDPIGGYIQDVPNPEATLGQLASMRSGIPSYTFDEGFQQILFADPNHVWTPQELVAVIGGMEPDFPAGTRTAYSNTNTVLLGMVIEQVTGRPLGDVIHDGIIEPLGLTGTVFPTDASFPDPHADGYTVQGQEDGVPVAATDWNPSWGWAAGAMTSTLEDLLVYGRELVVGDRLLDPAVQAQRLDSFDFTIPPNRPTFAYGLGIGLANGWYGHTGELPGYNTVMQHHLADDVTLIVMANSDIKAGECAADAPALPDGPQVGPCQDPAVHVSYAVAEALGIPLIAD